MSAAAHSFETLFDQSPHVVAHARGVMALAGDLRSEGPSLAIAAPLWMHVLVARRRDPVVHAASANASGPARMVYVLGEEAPWGAWVDHVQGVTLALREAGHDLPGFDLLVRSDLPFGIGLGASTALVVALLRALRDAYALDFDDDALVDLAHRAECAFAQRDCSRAAAVACVHAKPDAALLVGGGELETIALPDEMEATLVLAPATSPRASDRVTDSASPALAAARIGELAEALRAGDVDEIGALIDRLPGPRCELLASARRHPSVYGARCVGNGSAVVALVRRGEAQSLRAA